MAREYDEETGRKRETTTMKENVEDGGGEREKKKRTVRRRRKGKEARWYVGAAGLESVPDREEKKESGSV